MLPGIQFIKETVFNALDARLTVSPRSSGAKERKPFRHRSGTILSRARQ
jgi:hypothetical protein